MVLKLNKGIKKDLAIVVANHLSSVKEVKVNQLKKEILSYLEPMRTLNKKNRLAVQRLVAKPHRELVGQAIEEYVKVMETKPKRMLSQYMNFSCAKSKAEKFASLDFKERGKKIAEEWNKMDSTKKNKYNATKKVMNKYTLDLQTFKTSLKALKAKKV